MADEPKFPSYRYGPGGKAQIFQNAEDVPAGWEDHPSKVKGAKADAEPVEPRLSRPELMEALRQRGVQFAPNAGGGELAALLAAQPAESKPDEPLAGKNKADLLAIAKAEGVEIEDDATNRQIRDAIEAKRAE